MWGAQLKMTVRDPWPLLVSGFACSNNGIAHQARVSAAISGGERQHTRTPVVGAIS
jgi:hypothetical protein